MKILNISCLFLLAIFSGVRTRRIPGILFLATMELKFCFEKYNENVNIKILFYFNNVSHFLWQIFSLLTCLYQNSLVSYGIHHGFKTFY